MSNEISKKPNYYQRFKLDLDFYVFSFHDHSSVRLNGQLKVRNNYNDMSIINSEFVGILFSFF